MLLTRNRMIAMELECLMLALALAKGNVAIEDLLSVSSVKILQFDNISDFIISFIKLS